MYYILVTSATLHLIPREQHYSPYTITSLKIIKVLQTQVGKIVLKDGVISKTSTISFDRCCKNYQFTRKQSAFGSLGSYVDLRTIAGQIKRLCKMQFDQPYGRPG